ncbi:MAG: hypothetical protein KAI24_08535 [Planctomycetes bacterium]|nr:hypothetical protein [Planctomycetota bacterium]
MAQLRDHEAQIAAVGARIVLVGSGTPAMAKAFRQRHELRSPVLSDVDRRTFAAAGLRRGLRSLLHWRSLANLWRALRAGFRQRRVLGDAWQQGGVLVLGPDGAVRLRQIDEVGGDPIDVATLLAAVGAPAA